MNFKEKNSQKRILSYQLSEELSLDDLKLVSGGNTEQSLRSGHTTNNCTGGCNGTASDSCTDQ